MKCGNHHLNHQGREDTHDSQSGEGHQCSAPLKAACHEEAAQHKEHAEQGCHRQPIYRRRCVKAFNHPPVADDDSMETDYSACQDNAHPIEAGGTILGQRQAVSQGCQEIRLN